MYIFLPFISFLIPYFFPKKNFSFIIVIEYFIKIYISRVFLTSINIELKPSHNIINCLARPIKLRSYFNIVNLIIITLKLMTKVISLMLE